MNATVAAVALLALTSVFVVYNLPQKNGFNGEQSEMRNLFESWKMQHNKQYQSADEEAHKFGVFQDNVASINAHNADSTKTYTLAVNKFADLTSEEFASMYNGYRAEQKKQNDVYTFAPSANPDSVDWVAQGAVTAVKNQGQCGSCWSFSTTGSVEGFNVIFNKNKLTALSEQQLMDCSWLNGNKGCNGGLMDNAFVYVANKGLETEADYPYTAQSSFACKYQASDVVAKIGGHKDVTPNSVDQLETAVVQQPISVAVEADQQAWQFYNGGIVSDNCGQQLDHGVLVVGYDNTATNYWKIKNSWGADWGEQGYIRILKSADNVCGVLSQPSYPTQ